MPLKKFSRRKEYLDKMLLMKIALLLSYHMMMTTSSPASQRSQATNKYTRHQRNVHFETLPLPNYQLWTEDLTNIQFPPHQQYELTPDSDYDPHLIRGSQEEVKRITEFLYRKELFFGDIPHFQLVLRNQHDRRLNGLVPHRLGSIRIQSPFDISYQRV